MNNSILNKLATIERCLRRIRDVYALSKEEFDQPRLYYSEPSTRL